MSNIQMSLKEALC